MTVKATVSGMTDMEFILGDDVSWTVTVKVDGTALDLTSYTIRLMFKNQDDPSDTFEQTEADTDWIDNTDKASGQFDVLVDSTPDDISATGGTYLVKCAVETGTTRHHLGEVQWTFKLPRSGAYADL